MHYPVWATVIQKQIIKKQKIILKEPTETETIEILNNLQKSYEDYHKVTYGEEVIETIVRLSGRYMTDKQFPDKAIDVLDELGSEKRVVTKIPEIVERLKKEIEEIKEKLIQVNVDFNGAMEEVNKILNNLFFGNLLIVLISLIVSKINILKFTNDPYL